LNEGYCWKKKLFSEQGRAQLEKLVLAPWASRCRQGLLDRMNPTIKELTAAVEQEARKRPDVLRLMPHPGVGPLTALAYVLIIGTPSRFPRGKQIGNYRGSSLVRTTVAASNGSGTSSACGGDLRQVHRQATAPSPSNFRKCLVHRAGDFCHAHNQRWDNHDLGKLQFCIITANEMDLIS
jgi:hypothetical protein